MTTALPPYMKPQDTKLPAGHDGSLDPAEAPTDPETRGLPPILWPARDLSRGSSAPPDGALAPPAVDPALRTVPALVWAKSLPEYVPSRPVSLAIPEPSLDPDLSMWRTVQVTIAPFTGAPTYDGPWPKGWLIVDNTSTLYVCTVGGTPGTWTQVGVGAGVASFNTRTGAVTLLASDVEGLFTAAGQVFFGTGSGTGSLSDLLAALETKFSAAGQLIVGTGSATGELLARGSAGQALVVGGADPSGLQWGTPTLSSNANNVSSVGSTGSTQTLITTPSLAVGTWLVNTQFNWTAVAAGNEPSLSIAVGTATATFAGANFVTATAQGATPTTGAFSCIVTVTVAGTLLIQGVATNTGTWTLVGYTAVKIA